mgnify:FL=1
MDKTSTAAQTDKHSPEQAASVRISREMAAKLKSEWEDLQKRQNGRRVRSNDRISSVSIIRSRQGRESVRVNMGDGREILSASLERAAVEFEKTARKVYAGSRIEEFLRKIKENGWDAVEGEIPAEIKDAVRNACERANISLTSKGERAKEREAARQASQRAAEAADHAIKAAARPAAQPAAFDNKKAADFIVAAAVADFAASAFCKNSGMKMVKPTQQRRKGSSSKQEKIALKMPDGSFFEIKLVGDNINANRVKAQAMAEALFRREKGLPAEKGDEKLLAAMAKQKIETLADLQQKSGRVNNIADKLIPEKYKDALKHEKGKDIEHLKKFNEMFRPRRTNGEKKQKRSAEIVSLDMSVGRKIDDMVQECRANKKENKRLSAADMNKYTLLNFYGKMNKEDAVTPAAEKFAAQMAEKGVSGKELFAKYNNGKTPQKEMESYIADRVGGKLPAPVLKKDKKKKKQNTAASPAKETTADEKRRVLERMKADYAARKQPPQPKGLQQQIADRQTTPAAKTAAGNAAPLPAAKRTIPLSPAMQAALIKQRITPAR